MSVPTGGVPSFGGFDVPMGEQLKDLGYAAGWGLIRTMPEFAARNMFDAGALYAARGGGPEQLRKNLARVLGVRPAKVPGRIIRASLASYARYWREAFRLPSMNQRTLGERLRHCLVGTEHIARGLENGKGVILAVPHSGNWDMAGVSVVHQYGKFTTVAERLKPESLYNRFVEYRESLGFEILPLTGGVRPPFDVLTERLQEGRIVCLMADRDLSRNGVQVNLFGEPTRMPAGAAKLAVTTGATLLTVHCWNKPNDWQFDVSAPLDTSSGDVAAITQDLATRFEAGIAAHPTDWHMLQPQWLADLSEERRARLAGND
ncbi:phosphatidylinositol mannoside acyltransferase [Mycolicibacterium mucogenicum]|uniref:Phosphatidylinositol mannoside acyltransferase n=1 Tax=Mycolicibacterium mucogenicum DSM 44124 TaxID=1226753 RepID=A0A8H2JBT9_MYCMU|nr:phosphatidylinositol mannoside acyltransferase [Mycolicibacterium mucogenicum]KAB7758249.1 lauroyl acyltransferase [Mycolicibacterium mucogenicum DSM 44124]QPG71678.1 phosphatidylinositol mannoside acyltransferase [Mycolicibacterium mucogenicum DSM 44124]